MKRYNPSEIEPKWQKIWDESGTYTADLQSSKPKYIAMSMFNYPSGAGIHLGHAMNYTISDVKARFKRQQGFESYHPVGWDAFGLPAENYAIKAGVSPQESMATIIPSYHTQYKAMGWSNDWEKEIATHLPEYYKWTQWIFSQMYKHDLAYQDSRMQWWCTKCQTVLANEQVIDGKCWRHDGADDPIVEKKEVKQWFFKITAYADELLNAIDGLDWTDTVKLAQKNWIGRSVGAEVDFGLDFGDSEVNDRVGPDGKKAHITVFTTRVDTIFGATCLVLAPEHPWVTLALEHKTVLQNNDAVQVYVDQAARKSELERQTEQKNKTGVELKGVTAINPANDQPIPVWVADYVLGGYGTSAIMAVPAHDERDYEFARKFNLPIKAVVIPESLSAFAGLDIASPGADLAQGIELLKAGKVTYSGQGTLDNSEEFNGQSSRDARSNIVRKLAEQNSASEKVNFKMRDWSVSRQRYWGAPIPIINCPTDGAVLVPDEDLPVILPELDDFQPAGDGRSALARATDWLKVDCPKCGGPAERETDTLDTYICSSWYMYRYFDPRNQEQIFDSELVKKWEPIDFYNGADHATAHLLYARFIGHFFKTIGLVNEPEPFKQFLFNGKVTASDGTMFSKSKGNGIDPLEIIKQGYGADALRTYLMFSAPLEVWSRWDSQGVPGAHRFLSRLWNLVQEYTEAKEGELTEMQQKALLRTIHPMIHKMTREIEENRYNTAIASAMGALNELYKLKLDSLSKNDTWQQTLESMVACIAPFAPHVADELWFQLGHHTSIHRDTWPAADEKYLIGDTITIAIQVNGKLRGEITIDKDAPREEVEAAALAQENVTKFIGDKKPAKVIYVPGRLVNVVV